MSNTDFEDAGDGQAAEELVLDPIEDATGSGQEDDAPDAGASEDEAQSEGGGAEEVRPRSRRDNRIQTLLERAESERQRSERLEREIMEIKAERQARQQQLDPAQEAERLALMTPDERADYKLNRAVYDLRREQALMAFRNEDRNDKLQYDSRAQTDKIYAKYAARVEEARLKYMRENNTVIPREELLRHMVGSDVLKNRGKNVSRQQRNGQDNISRQQAPLANGRGNTQADRRSAIGNTQEARARRLAGVSI